MSDRRNFLKQSLLTLGAAAIGTQLAKAENLAKPQNKIEIRPNDIILFQGDSITDHNRNKDSVLPNDLNAMGRGYAAVAASAILNKYAGQDIQIFNRGIGGNKVPQLVDRWQKDCLDLKPNILSILVGVNDYWHKRNGKYTGSAQSYKDDYRRLIDRTLESLPKVKLIIGEPFAVKNVKHVDDTWFPEFAAYQAVSKDIAKEYKTVFIPYQKIFDEAEKKAPGTYWTTDGVHTTLAGVGLMAESWLSCIK